MVHVGRPVETCRILRDQRLAPAPRDLAYDALDPLIAPMFDQVVGERTAAHAEAGVAAAQLPLGFGQAEADRGEAVEVVAQRSSPRRTSCGGPQDSRSWSACSATSGSQRSAPTSCPARSRARVARVVIEGDVLAEEHGVRCLAEDLLLSRLERALAGGGDDLHEPAICLRALGSHMIPQ